MDKQTKYKKLRQLPWPNKIIIFAHMPKAAGISLNTIMKIQYGQSRVLELDPKQPRSSFDSFKERSFWAVINYRVISAHVLWGIHEWLPKSFVYITVLRHPVERVLSLYSYILSSPTHQLYNEMVKANMGLEAFLEWEKEMARLQVSNDQTKLLSSPTPYRETCDVNLLERAKNNLETYCIVGLTEEFAKSLEMFSNLFGWRNAKVARDNVTPNRIRRENVSPHTIRKIENLNQYDLELYTFGQQLFAEQSRDIHSVFARKTIR